MTKPGMPLSVLDARTRLPVAIAIGILMSVALWRLSVLCGEHGYSQISQALYWQDAITRELAMARRSEPDDPSPGVLRLLNLPLGFIVYGATAYLGLVVVGRIRGEQ